MDSVLKSEDAGDLSARDKADLLLEKTGVNPLRVVEFLAENGLAHQGVAIRFVENFGVLAPGC